MGILSRFRRQKYVQTEEGIRPAEEVSGTREWQRTQSRVFKQQATKMRVEREIEKLDTEIPLQKKKVELAKLRQQSMQMRQVRARGGGLIGMASRGLGDLAKGGPGREMGERAIKRKPPMGTSLAPSLFGGGMGTEHYDPFGGAFGPRTSGATLQKKKKRPQYDPIKDMLGR